MSVTMEIKGLEKFRKGLQDLPAKVAKLAMMKAVKYAAFILEEEVKQRAPVDSGALRDSIVSKGKTISPWEVSYKVQSMSNSENKQAAWYAPRVEYGHAYVIKRGKKVVAHGRVPQRPFFRPALDAQKENMQEVMVKEVSEAASKYWRKLSARS